MAFSDPIPSVAKAIVPFFHASLLEPMSREEKLGMEVLKPQNPRQVLKIDIYEAKGLCKVFSVETFFELWNCFHSAKY